MGEAVGLTALYAAFAVVALWLVGELLLQRRAPLPWRGVALLGFLALVGGVVAGSLPLIGAGVLGFGAGQFLASRAVKAGGGPYWVLVQPEQVPVVGRLFGGGGAGGDAGAEFSQPVVVGEVGPIEDVEPLPSGEPGVPGGEPVVATAEDSVYFGPGDEQYAYAPEQPVPYGEYAPEYTPEYAPAYAQYDGYTAAADPTQQQAYADASYGQSGQYEQYVQYAPQEQQQTYPDYGQQQYEQPQPQYDQYGGYTQPGEYAQPAVDYGNYAGYTPDPYAQYQPQPVAPQYPDYSAEPAAYPQQPEYTYPYPGEHHQG
ncbi:hypothetical protein [Streptacidiphilus fuscans]|uniref:Uncharacterized protein n=1 Tax=Streptacidiphilus fuscans TaxID=2789292 RepID=A0A931B688_9ACTN|nr:hypothetical protein [Streptacidiphilus fuscans]MBF9071008.1 hypothetical protein [Streptacidiphilus fuscans]